MSTSCVALGSRAPELARDPPNQPLDAKLVEPGTYVERDRYRIVQFVRRRHAGRHTPGPPARGPAVIPRGSTESSHRRLSGVAA